MIKTIIFDNGGVLVNDTWIEFLDNESRKLRISREEFSNSLATFVGEAVKGQITFEDFLNRVKNKIGSKEDVRNLLKAGVLDGQMVELVMSLRKKYQVALLTNDLGSFREDNKVWKMERLFGENIFCSSEMKVAKPYPEAFLFVLEQLKLEPEETVFIDDKARNIEVAHRVGMYGLLFKSLDDIKSKLTKIGVTVD